ncbi:MAG TPA: hypothetical protein VFS59_16315 [Gemmatimonadaceae bacterium]|nr:hypothetical protein [Gemmatimonadaceae bacterium]
MYVTVVWHATTEDAARRDEISHAVDMAYGDLPRAKITTRTHVLRPSTTQQLSTLVANLDGIEQVHTTMFTYAIFLHTDRDAYHCSDPFDVSAARAVTRTDPF